MEASNINKRKKPKISNVKICLVEQFAEDLSRLGFKFQKSGSFFKREMSDCRQKLSFDIYDFPTKIGFRLIVVVEISKIKTEADHMNHKFLNQHFQLNGDIMLREFDFYEQYFSLDTKNRNSILHEVDSELNLEAEVSLCKDAFMKTVLPGLQNFDDFNNFLNFALDNMEKVVHLSVHIPALIAAKLNGKDSFEKVSRFLRQHFGLEKHSNDHLLQKVIDEMENDMRSS